MLNPSDLEENPEMTGEYNVPRAILTFNKRIEPLMVVFKDEVRAGLIVDKPEDRGIFTTSQCELINGNPLGVGDQDDLNDVLTISEQEMSYWEKRGLEPFYIYEKAEEGWENQITGLPNLQTI
jgi:hypothetical protein